MQAKYLLIAFLAFAVGCGGADSSADKPANTVDITSTAEENNEGNDDASSNSTSSNKKSGSTNKLNNNWEKLTMVPTKDSKGTITSQAPFPSSWTIKNARQGEPSITGPNNVRVMDQPFKSFVYTNDYQMQQMYMQSGQPVSPWPGPDALVQQFFVPELNSQGWKFLRQYNVPEVAKLDKWYNDQLFKAMPSQTDVFAIGTEWQTSDGSKAFMITRALVSTTYDMQTWYYFSSVLKADKGYFDKAVKQYLFALGNTRYALEPIMAYNQAEAQRVGQSWAAFNQRMAQNQANFEQQQRNYVNNSNAINDAIMNGYNSRSASSDQQHQNYIDGIYEQDNATNTSTGNNYKTSIHYNEYWMNSNGEYISTNNSNYNPNLDDDLNGSNWDKLKKQD